MNTTRCMLAALLVLALGAGAAPAQDATDNAGADQAAAPAAVTARADIGFGLGIDRATRELVDAGAAFAAEDTVWCRTLLEGLAWPTTVTHAWYHEGITMARVDLNVGSAHWRTWSSKIIPADKTGAWEVKVLDANGSVLGSGAFEIR
jgi:hypothetical protein